MDFFCLFLFPGTLRNFLRSRGFFFTIYISANAFTFSKLTIESLQEGMKYVDS